MKRIHIIVLAVAACLACPSCEKWLDKAPDEDLTVDGLFNNRLYTDYFLSHIYTWCPTEANFADDGGAWRNPYVGGCDEMEIAYGGAYSHRLNDGAWGPTDISRCQVWPESYMGIRKVNHMLENIDRVPTNQSEIDMWRGESYFLRAFFHFMALRAYGPIPLVDRVLNADDDMLSIHRSKFDDCVDFIVSDLENAVKYLPAHQDGSELGRATSIAALGYKSRILLYAASPLYNGNTDQAALKNIKGENLISQTYDKEKWKKAADAALDCINVAHAAGYALYTSENGDPKANYEGIFTENWNSEIIWAKNIGTYYHHYKCNFPTSLGGFSILNPTQEQVDAYEMANGAYPITGYTNNGLTPIINPASGYIEEGFCTKASPDGYWQEGVSNMYVNREPRFYASINFAGQIWSTEPFSEEPHVLSFWYRGADGKSTAGSDYCKTGYLMHKFQHPDFRVNPFYTVNTTWIYMRLAEIYLNYAEALNEYSGPVEDVYKYVNLVRARGGAVELPKGLTQDQMRERIKHERRIELAFETHRFFDVRRWKDASKSENQPIHALNIYAGENMQDPAFYKRVEVEKRVFESPKHYLFPVDQTEIDKHEDGGLVQNLGW